MEERFQLPPELDGGNNGETEVDAARRRVKDLLKTAQITLKTLQLRAGHSRSAWSGYFNGTYEGRIDDMNLALMRFLEEWQDSKALAPITAFTTITKISDLAFRDNELAAVYGEAGVGKTASVNYYAQNNEHVILVQANRAIQAGEILMDILRKLRESQLGYVTLHTRLSGIQLALRKQRKLIIVDEADQLPVRTLEIIRAIYDDGNCGLVLIGLPRILDILTKGFSLRENLAQLYSRVGYRYEIKPPKINEVRMIIDRYGYRLSQKLIKEIKVWISGSGELRMLTKLMTRAKDLASWNGKKAVTDETVRAAYNLLIGGTTL